MIVYFSNVSGYTHRFVEKLGLPASRIPINSAEAGSFVISEPYILVCPSYAAGAQSFGVPKQVVKFLSNPDNRAGVLGVVAMGNRNFGDKFCVAGDQLSGKLGVPVLSRIELAGTGSEVEEVRSGVIREWDNLVALKAALGNPSPVVGVNVTTPDGSTMVTQKNTHTNPRGGR